MGVLRDGIAGIALLYCGASLKWELMARGTPEAQARFFACLFVAVGGAIILWFRCRNRAA